ncbi:recombinase family protein [Mycobacteroides abscessus]|uniref:recombinase family protein n=1 Tax=Mycobacteroides abscessus TaxID=36809 RepID=UPI00374E4E2A
MSSAVTTTDTAPLKTAVSYIRVSTKEQAERDGDPDGYSIPAQRDGNQRKADALNAVIVRTFIDRGESARSADRPDLQEMLKFLKHNPVNYAIVHKVDRLARNRVDDVEISLSIKKTGAELVSATENIDETPGGTLMHGILSSISEYFSRNLATEVLKGMDQKARDGGTPGMAPIGYLNVGKLNANNAEVRTVEIDPVRGPLIAWAFQTYATGTWTVTALAEELNTRGLTTRPNSRAPGRPVSRSTVQQFLTKPYYKGIITYRGATYEGRHEPLIDAATWAKVQEVLRSHAVGEKQREHPHYLKSTVYCHCGSRLVVTMAKNRHGTVYPYFVCVGRHQKRNACQQKAMLIPLVEQEVEEEYDRHLLTFTEEQRNEIETMISDGLQDYRLSGETNRKTLTVQKDRLTNERMRLLQAHYAGAIPLDLLKQEQDRIAHQLAAIEERLASSSTEFSQFEHLIKRALDLALYAARAYRQAATAVGGDQIRRLLNQAFFTKIKVSERTISSELAEPFKTLLSPETAATAKRHTQAKSAAQNAPQPLTGAISGENNKPAPRGAGLKETFLVPPTGFEPVLPP